MMARSAGAITQKADLVSLFYALQGVLLVSKVAKPSRSEPGMSRHERVYPTLNGVASNGVIPNELTKAP